MSAISLKSITGITSITTPAGVDDQLTLHNNNTTEAVKLDIAGNVHINNHLAVAGVTTFSNNVKFDGATAGRDVTFIRSSNTLEFATNAILELGNGGSGDCRLFNNGTDTRIINGDGTLKFESDTHEFKDKDNTTSYLNITSAGNVGINETTPESRLELDGRFRILDNSDGTPSSGKGLEISYYTSDDMADILSYDRGAAAYKKLQLRGSSIDLKKNNSILCTVGTGGNGTSVGFSTTVNLVTNAERIAVRGYSSFKSTNPAYAAIYLGSEGNTTNTPNQLLMFNAGGANRGGIGYVPNTGELRFNHQYFMTFCTGAQILGGTERLRIDSSGVLNLPAGIGPQLRFENQHSVTTDAAISTFDDSSGTLLCLGSNFYMNSSGSTTRYNTSEESAGILINRNGYITFYTGSTGATGVYRFGIASDGKVLIDNSTGTLTIGGDNVYDSAKINLMVGSMSQTGATTEETAIVIHDQNSRRNGTEGTGSWRSKIVFRSTQINGNSASEGASIVHDITYNNYSSTKMRSDLVFKTRGDAQTASSDAATEKLRIRHDGLVGINENQPESHLHVNSGTENDVATFESTDAYAHIYIKDSNTHADGTYFGVQGNDFRWITHNDSSSAERLRLTKTGSIQHRDGSGISYFNGASEYIFGSTTSSPPAGGSEAKFQVHDHKTRATLSLNAYMANAGAPVLQFLSSRSGTKGTLGTKAANGDYHGDIRFMGDNGTNYNTLVASAQILAKQVSTISDGDTVCGGELQFFTGNTSAGSVTEKFRIQNDGKIRYGLDTHGIPGSIQGGGFMMYANNGSNNITRITFTGLISGCYIATIGYYNAAGQGYGGAMFFVSGYQTANHTYDIHEVRKWGNGAPNSSISGVTKSGSNWYIEITNTHGSYNGGGEVNLYGDAQATFAVTYRQ